ncbi:phosphoadenosine phosphosulfate reductase family protein [[Clostridium] innocuum]|uniref:phosphoadenosine phosphosulfate reductase domain-containing protein n=1 Tax=Clostridium innocuum TaxID=1522 RepID=UPI0022E41F7F|nr:phosphoadenosine phosphosulfate reductase family protein [[Clostridium] innocuum]
MERIEALYNDTGGKCYVSFSGGKDSTVILTLIKMCEEIYTLPPDAIPAVFCNTGIELGATVEFVQWVKDNYYSNVQIIRPDPKKPFAWIIKNYGKPIKSKMKSEELHRWHAKGNEKSLGYLVDIDNKFNKTKIANKDLHMIHPDFDITVSPKCCKYLKKKPFEKYNKDNGIKGFITGLRSGEGGQDNCKQMDVSKTEVVCARQQEAV